MSKDLAIIVPFLDEEASLPRLVAELNRVFAERLERDWPGLQLEVIFVDDGSSDGSVEALERLEFRGYEARLVRLSRNFGSHAALRAGILASRAAATTFLTADLQDPPELSVELYRKLREGHEIVWARRERLTGSPLNRAFSHAYAWLMRRFVSPAFPAEGFDIVIFGPRVKDELNRAIESNSSVFLQILLLGFSQASVPYRRSERREGRSKWTFWKKVKLLIDSFVGFSYAPIRMVSLVGFALSGVGFAWMLFVVGRALLRQDLEPGWPSLVGILMIGFGVTNVSMGIIAEYLWRTLDASRRRPVFLVRDSRVLSGGRPA